jgi:hypothetical protein
MINAWKKPAVEGTAEVIAGKAEAQGREPIAGRTDAAAYSGATGAAGRL